MLLAIYWKKEFTPEEVKRNLESVFPEAVFSMERSKLNLKFPLRESPAVIREMIRDIKGVDRADWTE